MRTLSAPRLGDVFRAHGLTVLNENIADGWVANASLFVQEASGWWLSLTVTRHWWGESVSYQTPHHRVPVRIHRLRLGTGLHKVFRHLGVLRSTPAAVADACISLA
ncbi:MAG: hypothetical protein WAX89_07115 [Alphaproteobacteria bacterium]